MTPHFKLSEFVHEGEKPPQESIPLLLALCETVLEPIREWGNCPVIVTSGYRPPERNLAAGGAATSDHQWDAEGIAVDISFKHPEAKRLLATCHQWLYLEQYPLDQCILEWGSEKGDWRCIHLGYRPNPRRMFGYGATGGRSKYEWLP